MRNSNPQSVGQILTKLLKKTKLGKHVKQAAIWQRWPEIAGADLHPHGRPRAVKDNTLIIEVDSTVWMNKYSFFKWDIMKRINLIAARELVSDLFFVLASEDDPPQTQEPNAEQPGAAAASMDLRNGDER